ncbi:putative nuclease [Methanobrevibacter arboriphilus JCM 13429 = DSM 1125]|uniref:Putative nuclease n=1 Tax=Methanobrevibacter arboriphilus JCM 13429 = DSM 1125 TaxID=1300164 RepID=A0A1V6N293_METAZ|nr:putative nuclease [Methanobrevibacter arboriphilus JCM 13429 = DSM 1125]
MIILLIFILFTAGSKILIGSENSINSDYSFNNQNNQSYTKNNNNNNSNNNGYSNINNNSNNINNINNIDNNISINSENYKKYYDAKGFCDHVIDGDTIDVRGVGRIRLVGVNTPERGELGYQNATDFVKSKCLGKTIYLDIDDAKTKDKYGRILAIVYVEDIGNLNNELLKKGYAKVLFIPPSEFNPYEWT